jgi:cell wall-associated NlpC family hydrolase
VTVTAGGVAAVRVAVATLWSSPEAIRPLDAVALGPAPDIAAWVAAMSPDDQIGEGVLSQLGLGERVLVEEVRGDGWARVVALEQPAARLDPRGYPGWVPLAQLGTTVPRTRPAPASGDTDGPPAAPAPLSALGAPSLAAVRHMRPAPASGNADGPPAAPAPLSPLGAPSLAAARRLLGAPYVWGGLTPHGIDCSGLVRFVWRQLGVTLPRDADDQAAVTEPLALGDERAGDLYFFARPGRHIHHVGIVSAPRRMVHACYTQRRVVEEDLPPARASTLVAARRVMPLRSGTV